MAGTSGSSNTLQLSTVVPATMMYLHHVSKEQSSYWFKDTRARMPTSTALFKFPVMPRPTAQTWAHVENLHKWVLELCAVCGPRDDEAKFVKFIDTLNLVTPDDSLLVHERISEVFQYYTREGMACPLQGQTAYTSIILPRS